MSNTQALIEEIKSELSKYDDAGLLDENSMYRDIVQGLKRFGNDVLEIHETVVEVKDGEAQLPDNFKSLYLAYLCTPLGYTKEGPEIENHSLQTSLFYRERVIRTNKWSECESCCNEQEENVIRENLYFNGNQVSFYYHRPRLLKIGKSFNKTNIHSECRNRIVLDNPEEIVITGYRLKANFNEGDIYMQYFGLPVDDEGRINIPETYNGHLETYLEYYLKARTAERLLGNNDAIGLSNLYSVYKQESQIALRNASNDLKMGKINPQSMKRLKRLNRLETLQYEIGHRWR